MQPGERVISHDWGKGGTPQCRGRRVISDGGESLLSKSIKLLKECYLLVLFV